MQHLLRQPVTIVNPATATDDFGNEVADWANATETTERAYLEQTEASEVLVDRETYVSNWLVVLRSDSAIAAGSRVLYGDATFEVLGPPALVFNPRVGASHHIEARLTAVTG